jgi:hypothetical protein
MVPIEHVFSSWAEYQLWIPLAIAPRLLARQIAGYNHFEIATCRRAAPHSARQPRRSAERERPLFGT